MTHAMTHAMTHPMTHAMTRPMTRFMTRSLQVVAVGDVVDLAVGGGRVLPVRVVSLDGSSASPPMSVSAATQVRGLAIACNSLQSPAKACNGLQYRTGNRAG